MLQPSRSKTPVGQIDSNCGDVRPTDSDTFGLSNTVGRWTKGQLGDSWEYGGLNGREGFQTCRFHDTPSDIDPRRAAPGVILKF